MGGTRITLEVKVNPRKRGPSLRRTLNRAVAPPPESWAKPTVTIDKGKYNHDFLDHEVTLWAEYDMDFEVLKKVHQELKRNEAVVSYTVTNMWQDFYVEHNHAKT